jgi:hypothetical protein
LNIGAGKETIPMLNENAGELLRLWRKHQLRSFTLNICSSNPDSLLNEQIRGNDFKDLVKPMNSEPID